MIYQAVNFITIFSNYTMKLWPHSELYIHSALEKSNCIMALQNRMGLSNYERFGVSNKDFSKEKKVK